MGSNPARRANSRHKTIGPGAIPGPIILGFVNHMAINPLFSMYAKGVRVGLLVSIQSIIKGTGGSLLEAWDHMRINVQGHANGTMPEPFREDFGVDVLGQHQTGVCLPCVM